MSSFGSGGQTKPRFQVDWKLLDAMAAVSPGWFKISTDFRSQVYKISPVIDSSIDQLFLQTKNKNEVKNDHSINKSQYCAE